MICYGDSQRISTGIMNIQLRNRRQKLVAVESITEETLAVVTDTCVSENDTGCIGIHIENSFT
jgi:hypothetical protein